jgi:hypothetical protein
MNPTPEEPPNDPDENLAFMLEKYRVINESPNRMEEARKFLAAGETISLPYVVENDGQKRPYRLYPMASYHLINSCVKTLEKHLEMEVNGGSRQPEDERQDTAIMCLADMLFAGACKSPDGKFTVHWVSKARENQPPKITINPHGRRVKQLADRLEKYRQTRIELARRAGKSINLPDVSAPYTIKTDIEMSYSHWKMVDPYNWDGRTPWELTDSVESRRENLGEEVVQGSGEAGLVDDYEEEIETQAQVVAQAKHLGLELPETLRYQAEQRGNVMATSPKAWIWDYDQSPVDFTVNYLCDNARGCLEEAHSLLLKSRSNRAYEEAGSQALLLDFKTKTNPENFWQIIKRITGAFPSNREEEEVETLEKLDTARFTVCLELTNRKLGINPDTFQEAFYNKIHGILADPARRETTTRNEVLMECVRECPEAKAKNWGEQEVEQWLEHLQSTAVGAYENSTGMETARKKLLAQLNRLFKAPREALESTQGKEQEEVIGKLQVILQSAANEFYKALSGKTGQMARRELRTKVYEMKGRAHSQGNNALEEKLGEMGRFIGSISSQIKSGQWYEHKEENTERIRDFLTVMLETPKGPGPEFPGSPQPAAKDPLEITCEFLRKIEGTKHGMGHKTIQNRLAAWKTNEMTHEGGQLAAALQKVARKRGTGAGPQDLRQTIQERSKTLEAAITLSQRIHEAADPVKETVKAFEEAVSVLRSPHSLKEEDHKGFEENLYFWKGVHYLGQNIQSRGEEGRYQLAATSRGTIQNLIAMAKAKLENRELTTQTGERLSQFSLTRTRERSLIAGAAVPLALWLEKPEKGCKTIITHQQFVAGLQERKEACDICLEIAKGEKDIERKTMDYAERNAWNKKTTNSFVIAEVIGVLEEPKDMTAGIQWAVANPQRAAEIASITEADTPGQILAKAKENPKTREPQAMAIQ